MRVRDPSLVGIGGMEETSETCIVRTMLPGLSSRMEECASVGIRERENFLDHEI